MGKRKIIIYGAGASGESVVVNEAEESVERMNRYIAVFMSRTDCENLTPQILTEASKEQFYIVLTKKRVTTILMKRNDSEAIDDNKQSYGEDFSGVALVLYKCKNLDSYYSLVLVEGSRGSYSNIIFDTFGFNINVLNVFKAFLDYNSEVKKLPDYDFILQEAAHTIREEEECDEDGQAE